MRVCDVAEVGLASCFSSSLSKNIFKEFFFSATKTLLPSWQTPWVLYQRVWSMPALRCSDCGSIRCDRDSSCDVPAFFCNVVGMILWCYESLKLWECSRLRRGMLKLADLNAFWKSPLIITDESTAVQWKVCQQTHTIESTQNNPQWPDMAWIAKNFGQGSRVSDIWCQAGTGPRLKKGKLSSSAAMLSGLRFPSKEPVWSGWALPRFCQHFNFIVRKPPLIPSPHLDGRHRDKQLVSAVKVLQCQWHDCLYTHTHTENLLLFCSLTFYFNFITSSSHGLSQRCSNRHSKP